jgi:hypothetical protein
MKKQSIVRPCPVWFENIHSRLKPLYFCPRVKLILKQPALDIGVIKLNPSAGTQPDLF